VRSQIVGAARHLPVPVSADFYNEFIFFMPVTALPRCSLGSFVKPVPIASEER